MQAVEIRRMTVNRIIVAAAVAGTVVAGTVGLVISDVLDDDRARLSIPAQRAQQPFDYVFIEQNTQLPEVRVDRAAPTMDRADFMVAQRNTSLADGMAQQATRPSDRPRNSPSHSGLMTQSAADIRFYEDNTNLPTSGSNLALLAPERRAQTGEVNF